MIKVLIKKELQAILSSPKFIAVFAVCSILIIMSIYIGIDEYNLSMRHYEAANANNSQQMLEITDWRRLNTSIIRRPDPMLIFVSGINNDVGRQYQISDGSIKLQNSNYSENTIFAVFRSMDLMFIVQIVLSLFAIVFSYDLISGEKEAGTLKLCFANQLPRRKYIIAKYVGSWLGLIIPLLLPLMLGVMLILLYNIPMTTTHWLKLCVFVGLSFIYISFFLSLGMLLSSLNRESSKSFLYLLVIWVCLVLIIPRTGVMVAGQFISVPTTAEISSKLSQKNRELSTQFIEWVKELRKKVLAARSNKERAPLMKELQEKRVKLSQDKAQYDALLNDDLRNRKIIREKLGFSLSRISPASAFQLAAMDLAGTGASLVTTYEDQIRDYKDSFIKIRGKKIVEASNNTFNATGDNKPKRLDLSELPEFKYNNPNSNQIIKSIIIDVGIIFFCILLSVAGTFIIFNKYDVR